jgi:hypothetical protein
VKLVNGRACKRCNTTGLELSSKNRNNRSRGHSLERKVIQIFKEWWVKPDGTEYDWRRTPQSGGSPLASEWRLAGDVCVNDPEFPFTIECKNEKGWNLDSLITSPEHPGRIFEYINQAMMEKEQQPGIPLIYMTHPGPSQPVFVMLLLDMMNGRECNAYNHITKANLFTGRVAWLMDKDIWYVIFPLKEFLKQWATKEQILGYLNEGIGEHGYDLNF